MLDLLGRAGCVSIEAGVESLTEADREALDKRCRMTTDELADRLIYARGRVPFVQANLIETRADEATLVADWRARLDKHGVWANDPVPLYPYPSSPDYRRLWGPPDDRAWERAHEHYLAQFASSARSRSSDPPRSRSSKSAARDRGRPHPLHDDAVGGVWTYTIDLADALQQGGASVRVVTFAPGPTPTSWRTRRGDGSTWWRQTTRSNGSRPTRRR